MDEFVLIFVDFAIDGTYSEQSGEEIDALLVFQSQVYADAVGADIAPVELRVVDVLF